MAQRMAVMMDASSAENLVSVMDSLLVRIWAGALVCWMGREKVDGMECLMGDTTVDSRADGTVDSLGKSAADWLVVQWV